jgi:hypothetical protein
LSGRAGTSYRLHIPAVRAVVQVEIVHVARSQHHRQGVGHLANRQPDAARAIAVDLDDELRIVAVEAAEEPATLPD